MPFSVRMVLRLVTASSSGAIALWNTLTCEPLVTFTGFQGITTLAFRPDGSRLYAHEHPSSFVRVLDGRFTHEAGVDEVLIPKLKRFSLIAEIKNDIERDMLLTPTVRQATLQRLDRLPDTPESEFSRILEPIYFSSAPDPDIVRRSMQYLEEKVQRDEYDVPTLLSLAVTCLRARQHERSLELLRDYVTLDGGESSEVLSAMAIAYLGLGRREEARAMLERARRPLDDRRWRIDDRLTKALLAEAESLVQVPPSPSQPPTTSPESKR